MALLEPPAEILDLQDGGTVEFRIERAEQGELEIRTREAPAPRTVAALRLHVPHEDKPEGAPYWDVTAGNLIARLRPSLERLVRQGQRIKVTKIGVAPVARHRVDFL